jgi:hypothetical protein
MAVQGFGVPREHYRFTFEEGLPDKIVRDLKRATPAGGVMPVMQIVCGRLYNAIGGKGRPEEERIIRESDYLKLGGIEGQVGAHLEETLFEWCVSNGLEGEKIERESNSWKLVFYTLVKNQVDGTVTTELKTEEVLQRDAIQFGCTLDPADTLRHLAREEQRLLRQARVFHRDSRQIVTCYSLGHDAIGLALDKWKVAWDETRSIDEKSRAYRSKMIIYFTASGALALGMAASLIASNFIRSDNRVFRFVMAFVASLMLGTYMLTIDVMLRWRKKVLGTGRFQRPKEIVPTNDL